MSLATISTEAAAVGGVEAVCVRREGARKDRRSQHRKHVGAVSVSCVYVHNEDSATCMNAPAPRA